MSKNISFVATCIMLNLFGCNISEKKDDQFKDQSPNFDTGKVEPSKILDTAYYPSILPALKVFQDEGLVKALDFVHEPYPWFDF
jgi:hypothetical protein